MLIETGTYQSQDPFSLSHLDMVVRLATVLNAGGGITKASAPHRWDCHLTLVWMT
jgi:hypothetical protein